MNPEEPTVRELPREEWAKLQAIPELAGQWPNPNTTRVVVAEDSSGELLAYWFFFLTWHTEPMGILPKARQKPGLIRKLWGKILDLMDEYEAPLAFAVIEDKDLPNGNDGYARRLGFAPIAGKLYFVQREAMLDTRHKESA